jgi:UDP-3-O-[3-hydroxymyristoyl] glucosamine N-acyltransferase
VVEQIFDNVGVEEIIQILFSSDSNPQVVTDSGQRVVGVAEFPPGKLNHLSFWTGTKIESQFNLEFEGVLIAHSNAEFDFNYSKATILTVSNPRLSFAVVTSEILNRKSSNKGFIRNEKLETRIHETAIIESGAIIGNGCEIGPNVFVGKNTVIGDLVKIGPNSSISTSGFGYVKKNDGSWQEQPQLGKVIIGSNVRIGANVCIDRATISETFIEDGVKIDNHVHIGHNSLIGKDTVITACVELSGGVTIGKNVWIGPQTSIREKISIGDGSFIGIGSVVIRDVKAGTRVAGNPARTLPD